MSCMCLLDNGIHSNMSYLIAGGENTFESGVAITTAGVGEPHGTSQCYIIP